MRPTDIPYRGLSPVSVISTIHNILSHACINTKPGTFFILVQAGGGGLCKITEFPERPQRKSGKLYLIDRQGTKKAKETLEGS
eukprot:766086-Pelagomonas_calceolata.AAC.1